MYGSLNDKYILLFSTLQASKNVLPKKQYDQMADALMQAYKRELTLLVGRNSLDTSREMFELKQMLNTYVPWKFLFFKNKVAKVIIKACKEQFEVYLSTLYQDSEIEEAPLEPKEETALVSVSADVVPADTP